METVAVRAELVTVAGEVERDGGQVGAADGGNVGWATQRILLMMSREGLNS